LKKDMANKLLINIFYLIDLVKDGEGQNDSPERTEAVKYLEEASHKKSDAILRVLQTLSNAITKEELGEHLKDNWFNSFKLRMFVAGKSPEPKKVGPPEEPKGAD
jgi:hypothetical protein